LLDYRCAERPVFLGDSRADMFKWVALAAVVAAILGAGFVVSAAVSSRGESSGTTSHGTRSNPLAGQTISMRLPGSSWNFGDGPHGLAVTR
jgi:hypothetical protein